MTGTVINIFTSPARSQPMVEHQAVRAIAGQGLEGDRYSKQDGTYTGHPRVGACEVSLISLEAIEAANRDLTDRGLEPFELNENRRNIIVEGFDVQQLIGKEFMVGDVRMRGGNYTKPCLIPSKVAGKIEFAQAYKGRGGIRAVILNDGIINIGAAVLEVENTQ